MHSKTFWTAMLLLGSAMVVHTQTPAKPKEAKTIAAIRDVLDAQRDAWNRGDIEGYMDGYERSEQTVFVSGDNLTRGWQTVLDRYKKNYNMREKMGTLTFSDLEITLPGKESAITLRLLSVRTPERLVTSLNTSIELDYQTRSKRGLQQGLGARARSR